MLGRTGKLDFLHDSQHIFIYDHAFFIANPWFSYMNGSWQAFYWLPLRCLLEPVTEILSQLATCINGLAQVLEAPKGLDAFRARLRDVLSWWLEALLSPGFQGAAFMFQAAPQALAGLLLSRALAKLLLLPFAEAPRWRET